MAEERKQKEKHQEVNILIVDDNKVNQLLFKKILTQRGYKSESVNNGVEALDAVRTRHFDLILMDVQMPIMDGIQATRHIRKFTHAQKRNLPILAVTAHVFEKNRKACMTAGMNAFLTKPVDPSELYASIDEHLNNPLLE